jgi:hypothetical protein
VLSTGTGKTDAVAEGHADGDPGLEDGPVGEADAEGTGLPGPVLDGTGSAAAGLEGSGFEGTSGPDGADCVRPSSLGHTSRISPPPGSRTSSPSGRYGAGVRPPCAGSAATAADTGPTASATPSPSSRAVARTAAEGEEMAMLRALQTAADPAPPERDPPTRTRQQLSL